MFLAGAGGFAGTCCRYLINRLFLVIWNLPFPLATFTINILGCFLFGIITGFFNKFGIINPSVSVLLTVGFCGGFTTFSTFSAETLNLMTTNEILLSLIYVIGSIIAGVLAVWTGNYIAR